MADWAHAAHPLQTEDTGTQGTGNVEIENGFERVRSGPDAIFTYQPQVSIGLSPTFDAIVQPSFIGWHTQGPGGPDASGLGDTNADFKWRFLGIDPFSFAVRAGLELPTAQHGLGLPHGDVATHALAVMTIDQAPTSWYANLGVTHNPELAGTRATLAGVSGAVLHAVTESFYLTADTSFGQSNDPRRHGWPGTLLGGIIYTVRPGFDLDLGWQASLHDAPVSRAWLAGATWRFAL
jgi:Putative MetA-pathway of phenol degradation